MFLCDLLIFEIIDKKEKKIIDLKLKNVNFPIEFSRKQRSIIEIKSYKANEIRNFLFYLIPSIFYNILPDKYFEHILTYVTFIRILTQNEITNQDILDSIELINHFCEDFEDLYSLSHMTYKLHSHLHLPAQVIQYGPLHEISCFPFESS